MVTVKGQNPMHYHADTFAGVGIVSSKASSFTGQALGGHSKVIPDAALPVINVVHSRDPLWKGCEQIVSQGIGIRLVHTAQFGKPCFRRLFVAKRDPGLRQMLP